MRELNMSTNQTYEGTIMVRGKGTGFFAIPDSEEDIVVSSDNLSFALDRDTVEIELLPRIAGRRQEGKVIKVIEAANSEFVGTVKKEKAGGGYYLSPDNHRIHIRPLLPEANFLPI